MLFGAVFVQFVPGWAERLSRHLHYNEATVQSTVFYGLILLAVLFVMPDGAAGFLRRCADGASRIREQLAERLAAGRERVSSKLAARNADCENPADGGDHLHRQRGRTRIDARRRRREELLDAADRVISRLGPQASMDEIASEAGITKPILYRHFGDKDGLHQALAARYVDALMSALRAAEASAIRAPTSPPGSTHTSRSSSGSPSATASCSAQRTSLERRRSSPSSGGGSPPTAPPRRRRASGGRASTRRSRSRGRTASSEWCGRSASGGWRRARCPASGSSST